MTRHRTPGNLFLILISLLFTAIIVTIVAFKFEFFKPDIAIKTEFTSLGRQKDIVISARDALSGLQEITVGLLQAGKEVPVLKQSFPGKKFLLIDKVKEYSAPLTMRPLDSGLHDGQATLRVSVRDNSWWGWFSGNKRVLEKKILVDTQPPPIYILSTAHNLNQGGSGLVVYQTESTAPVTGVLVGDRFYRGYPKQNAAPGVSLAYFPLPWDAPQDISLLVTAQDEAGNTARVSFPYHIRPRKFTTNRFVLSPAFFQTKLPELRQHCPDLKESEAEAFIQVNHTLRTENDRKIAQICSRSQFKPLWKGPFLRMPGAAPSGLFADQRTYVYAGREIDRGVHLGVDLAATKQSPIPAANTGLVIHTGYLGIYGNTVFLDHGQGIFSMYAHLSNITVVPGQMVETGTPLGFSGSTGLAGGDHLHFSMLVGGTFVNPVEWWDNHWIQDNIILNMHGESIPSSASGGQGGAPIRPE